MRAGGELIGKQRVRLWPLGCHYLGVTQEDSRRCGSQKLGGAGICYLGLLPLIQSAQKVPKPSSPPQLTSLRPDVCARPAQGRAVCMRYRPLSLRELFDKRFLEMTVRASGFFLYVCMY